MRGMDGRLWSLRRLLAEALRSPGAAGQVLAQAEQLAADLSALPVGESTYNLPGLSLPVSNVIEVQGFPSVPAGATKQTTVNMGTAGVVVGILFGSRENDALDLGALSYQITMDGAQSFGFNGGAQTGYVSGLAHCENARWMASLMPCRGSGNWNIEVKNTGPAAYTPIMNFGFLKGAEWIRRYCGAVDSMG